MGGLHHAAVALQEVVGGAADVLVGVGHQNPPAAEQGPFLDLHRRRQRLGRGLHVGDVDVGDGKEAQELGDAGG